MGTPELLGDRRYVHRVSPPTPEAVVRVHTAPGENCKWTLARSVVV